ncbi:MAG: hypothetical protein V4669_13815 [Pseudomonadota bacterium]
MRDLTYREKLERAYHAVIWEIAGALVSKPTEGQLKSLRDFYREQVHPGRRHRRDLTDAELSSVIYQIEARAALRAGISFSAYSRRAAAREPAAYSGA